MNNNEQVYLDLLQDILDNGVKSDDRTGVGTLSVFGRQMRFDLTESFPLVTTKKVPWKGITSELLWFIEGSGDERRLAELRYGKPREELEDKNTIWTENANAPYWKNKAKYSGDLGRIYSHQWRKWLSVKDPRSALEYPNWSHHIKHLDQLAVLIESIKKDPYGRRHILTAWNPGELDYMALPPCHMMSQFYVRNGELSCLMTQRSGDSFLGIPFNIASYSLLTMMIAQVCRLKPKEFILSLGDAHLYLNSLEAVEEQLKRNPLSPPTVVLNESITNIDDFTMDDITLVGYESHPALKVAMAI